MNAKKVYLNFPEYKAYFEYIKSQYELGVCGNMALVVRRKFSAVHVQFFIRLTANLDVGDVLPICDVEFFAGLTGEKTPDEIKALKDELLKKIEQTSIDVFGSKLPVLPAEFQLEL